VRAQQQSPDFFDAGRLSALAQLFTVAPDIADVSQPPLRRSRTTTSMRASPGRCPNGRYEAVSRQMKAAF